MYAEHAEVSYICLHVIVIARGQGFMAVNRSESEGEARGQGRFTLLWTNQTGYIIVIARLPGIYGNVNPWPRAITITNI